MLHEVILVVACFGKVDGIYPTAKKDYTRLGIFFKKVLKSVQKCLNMQKCSNIKLKKFMLYIFVICRQNYFLLSTLICNQILSDCKVLFGQSAFICRHWIETE